MEVDGDGVVPFTEDGHGGDDGSGRLVELQAEAGGVYSYGAGVICGGEGHVSVDGLTE